METDYLIIGAGAMGVAFADEILTQNPRAKLTLVDKRSTFGGHWNDAYDFVKLHQPAAFYGVNSLDLGNGGTDLSSKEEILEYYDKILQKFKKSGRVKFLNNHKYIGNHQIVPLAEPDKVIQFTVHKKVVNAGYMNVQVPSTDLPKFKIDEGVTLMPLNELVTQYNKWEQFFVIGNGKTGIDAVLFLLKKGVKPQDIQWISPNDAWLFNRSYLQIGKVTSGLLDHVSLLQSAEKADDVFLEMEKVGGIFRLDEDILPTKWRCATVSLYELDKLREIKNIIRKGRVKQITSIQIELEQGSVSYSKQTLFVNCTADGLAKRDEKPVFSKGLITLQPIFLCQQVFSAAVIAKLETSKLSDKKRNLIKPVAHPEYKEDWPEIVSSTIRNLLVIHGFIPIWMFKSRLNFMSYESPLKYIYYATKAAILYLPMKKGIKRINNNI